MATKRRRPPNAHNFSIANPRLSRLPVRPAFRPLRAVTSRVEDFRHFHPLGPFRPLHASPRSAARVVVRNPRSPWKAPDVLGFAVPHKVRRCVQRKERREVLFAKRLTRSGSGSPKRRNMWSGISCK